MTRPGALGLVAVLAGACGARSDLAGAPGDDAGAPPAEASPDATRPPSLRVFASTAQTPTPTVLHFDLPATEPKPLPLAPATFAIEGVAIARVGDRLYVADGSNGIVWFDHLGDTIDGPHTLWTMPVASLAYAPSTHALYAIAFTEDATSTVLRFDTPEAASTSTPPSASFPVDVAWPELAAGPDDRLYFVCRVFSYGYALAFVDQASALATGDTPPLHTLAATFSSSYPAPLAVGATRVWFGGIGAGAVPEVIGYELATMSPSATPAVTLGERRWVGYVGALDAEDDVLAVAIDHLTGGYPPPPPVQVAIYTGAHALPSNAPPARPLYYPSSKDGWCGYAITALRYSAAGGGTVFAAGWGYLAVDQNVLGAPSRYVVDPCESGDAAFPPVYWYLEPLDP
jgi:hypothetical protein